MGRRVGIRLDDPETADIWETCRRAAREVAGWPAWKRAGINLNPQHFETYPGDAGKGSAVTKIFAQDWEERERGWGGRPDGTTLHADLPAAGAYVAAYNARHNHHAEAPDEYRCAWGEPYEIDVGSWVAALVADRAEEPDPLDRAVRVARVGTGRDERGFRTWHVEGLARPRQAVTAKVSLSDLAAVLAVPTLLGSSLGAGSVPLAWPAPAPCEAGDTLVVTAGAANAERARFRVASVAPFPGDPARCVLTVELAPEDA